MAGSVVAQAQRGICRDYIRARVVATALCAVLFALTPGSSPVYARDRDDKLFQQFLIGGKAVETASILLGLFARLRPGINRTSAEYIRLQFARIFPNSIALLHELAIE